MFCEVGLQQVLDADEEISLPISVAENKDSERKMLFSELEVGLCKKVLIKHTNTQTPNDTCNMYLLDYVHTSFCYRIFHSIFIRQTD